MATLHLPRPSQLPVGGSYGRTWSFPALETPTTQLFAPRPPLIRKSQGHYKTSHLKLEAGMSIIREGHLLSPKLQLHLPQPHPARPIAPKSSPPTHKSQRYLLAVLSPLHFTLSTRGARAGQPQSACAVLCRSFSAFRAFSYALLYVGDAGVVSDAAPRSTVALPARAHEDHEEVPGPV